MQDNYRDLEYPATITPNDLKIKNNYILTKDRFKDKLVREFSESPARYLEVYRTKKAPTSYESFANSLVSRIDLRIPNTHYNRTDYTFFDKIISNQKYYYLFRFVTENDMPGHLSVIYEATLVDDGGYKFAKFNTYDTSNFIKNFFEDTSIGFKKIFKLDPNISQMTLNVDDVNFSKKASEQIENVRIGPVADNIFDKKFKIRLTSKKTGKKTDLNVTFNLRTQDFS